MIHFAIMLLLTMDRYCRLAVASTVLACNVLCVVDCAV